MYFSLLVVQGIVSIFKFQKSNFKLSKDIPIIFFNNMAFMMHCNINYSSLPFLLLLPTSLLSITHGHLHKVTDADNALGITNDLVTYIVDAVNLFAIYDSARYKSRGRLQMQRIP